MYVPEPSESSLKMLDAADRLARATDLWVRRGLTAGRFGPVLSAPDGRRQLAAGILSGLCEALELGADRFLFALYVYALLNDDTRYATEVARFTVDVSQGNETAEYFRIGRAEASSLMQLLEPPFGSIC